MIIRKASLEDIPRLRCIFEKAKAFMTSQGNPNQWIQGYPAEELIREQVLQGWCYACEENNSIVATFCFIPGPDPTYQTINGAWLSECPYSVIHRIASDGSVKGVANVCIEWCKERCRSLRVDTHQDNKIMQNILLKHGFKYCGIIRVANGTERLAYQLDF